MKIDVEMLSSDEIRRIGYDQLALLSRDIIRTVEERKCISDELFYNRLKRFKHHLNWIISLHSTSRQD